MKALRGVVLTGVLSILMGMSVMAADNEIQIDSNNFPEECLRQEINKYDVNKDGYLSDEESKSIKKLTIYKYPDLDGMDDVDISNMKIYYEKSEFKFDFKGIDKLEYLEKLQVLLNDGYTKEGKHYSSVASNIKCLYNTKKLKELSLSSVSFKKLDTTKIKKLKKLYIGDNPALKTLKYNKNLTNLSLSELDKMENFNIPSLKKLKSCELSGKAKTVKIAECPKLKSVTFFIEAKSLDTSKLKNLKKIYFENGKVQNFDFSQNRKLQVFSVNWTKMPEKLDLSKNCNLTELSIDGKGVKNISLAKNNKIEWLRWANAGLKKLSLKDMGLNPKYLKTVILWGNPKLKSVNIKGYKKVKDVIGESGIKVIK